MKRKDSKTEEKITIQVMAGWYMKFCQSKHYSKMKKVAQKNSERAILDLLCIMYYEFDLEPDEWLPQAMEKYCLIKLLDELYHERDEEYFKSVFEILLSFFNFLKDFKLQKNADAIADIIKKHGSYIFESYQKMSEEDEEEYSDDTLQEIMENIEEWLDEFTKTKYFSVLDDKYKDTCEDIIMTFSQFIYEYTLLRPSKWDTEGLFEICVDVMPRKVMADDEYFESITPSLKAFFLFMDEKKINHNALELANEINALESKIIKASKKSSNWGIGKQILNQAVKKGVDLSDKNKLTKFLNSMMGKPLPPIEDEEIEEEPVEEFNDEYDNVIPFARKTPKVGRNDPCPCGSGKKYKKCCGR